MFEIVHAEICRMLGISVVAVNPVPEGLFVMNGLPGHDRKLFPGLFANLGYKVGAEIGVLIGEFSEQLLIHNPDLKLYCIDPYIPYSEVLSPRKQRRIFAAAQQRLAPYKDRMEFVIKTSMSALDNFPDKSLDFVYIDGAHDFDNVLKDVFGWYEKVREGGILAGHDYFVHRRLIFGIIPAVNQLVKDKGIKYLYITVEKYPSWLLVIE